MRGSDFYGIDNTLLRYAGLPRVGALPFAVQHGWQHAATRFEADGRPLEIWAWSERSREAMAAHYPRERIRVVGSPYLYLDALEEDSAAPHRPALYVLPHSSHFARIGFSLGDLRALLAEIGATDGGCDVLAYYLDVNEALCATLRPTRSRILLNGGLWSRDFMQVFRRNIRLYERVHFSSFGSAILFARHEQRQTRYVELASRVVMSTNLHVDRLEAGSSYEPTGAGVDTRTELGVGKQLERREMRALILEGWRQGSPGGLAVRAGLNTFNRLRDHFCNVRPRMALAARHNVLIDGHD
jgi:hypothetical protein